jgi:aminoglycoside phosphotransferase (APT) family kinase protein
VEHTTEPTAESLWDALALRLRETLGETTFDTWFAYAEPRSFSDGALLVIVPNDFTRDWIDGHFRTAVASAAHDATGRELAVSFGVAERNAPSAGAAPPVESRERGAGADMPYRVSRVRDRLLDLPLDLWRPPAHVEDTLRAAEGLKPTSAAALVHGDLHIRHLLVDGGSVSGVIDWGDLCFADPAVDLMLLWLLLSPEGRRRFIAVYGPIDEERLLRARVIALFLGLALALYARDVGNARLERESVAALERTLID